MAHETPAQQSSWNQAKAKSKEWFEKVGVPVNKATNKLGAEAFWPTSLDKESDKAARILRSFCMDGFRAEKDGKGIDHIPVEVIKRAKGLAIFTVFRTGLHWSGAGGSGIVVARTANGSWSPPSGILIHTLGWGLIAGADIYDCVCVINNDQGMEGFTRVRCTLGGEVSAAVGPLGGGSNVESELQHPAPVWAYTKSRGLYAGIQVDGTIIAERTSENERFYGQSGVRNSQILTGEVQPPQGLLVQLWETMQACEGAAYDSSKLPTPSGKTPGDEQVEEPQQQSQSEYDRLEHHAGERMDYRA